MFGTTREFLDYFGLKKLDDLPPLSEFQDLENINPELGFPEETPQVDLLDEMAAEELSSVALAALTGPDEAEDSQEESNVVSITRSESSV